MPHGLRDEAYSFCIVQACAFTLFFEIQAANALDKYIVSACDFDCIVKFRGHLFWAIVWPALSASMRRRTEHKSCMKTKTPTRRPHGTDTVAILIVDRDSPFDFL